MGLTNTLENEQVQPNHESKTSINGFQTKTLPITRSKSTLGNRLLNTKLSLGESPVSTPVKQQNDSNESTPIKNPLHGLLTPSLSYEENTDTSVVKPQRLDNKFNDFVSTPRETPDSKGLTKSQLKKKLYNDIQIGANGLLTPTFSPSKRKLSFGASDDEYINENNSNSTREHTGKLNSKQENELRSPRKKLTFDESAVSSSPRRNGKLESTNIYTTIKKSFKDAAFAEELGSENGTDNNSTVPSLVSREFEYNKIMEFMTSVLNDEKSNSLYITGPPGTGKTAQVKRILDKHSKSITLEGNDKIKEFTDLNMKTHHCVMSSLNCMSLNNAKSIYSYLLSEFTGQVSKGLKSLENLQEYFEENKYVSFVVVLDEIDYLCNGSVLSKPILIDLFLATKSEKYKLILIGISNSLDMTDKFLSRLKLDINLQPQSIIFKPYTDDQIFKIISAKLKSIPNAVSVIQPMAIKFLAKKMSSSTGDLRKVLGILRRAIEMLELEELKAKSKQVNKPGVLDADPAADGAPAQAPQPSVVRKITVAHIAKACNYEVDSSNTKSRIDKLNLHQKIIFMCLIHKHKYDVLGCFSVDECYDYYYQRLTRDVPNLFAPLSRLEYGEITNTLEMMGLCNITLGLGHNKSPTKKGGSPSKVKYSTKLLTSPIKHDQLVKDLGDAGILMKFL